MGKRRGAALVQGPEKFACQNEAVLSLLPARCQTSVRPGGQSLGTYLILFRGACVSSRKTGNALRVILVPLILATLIFLSPGQREKLIS